MARNETSETDVPTALFSDSDTLNNEEHLEIDSISDINSNSSIGDFQISSDEESDLDMDDETGRMEFTVPDIKAYPPKWTENLQTFIVPPFRFKGGPTLPDTFSDTSVPLEYFKLFFTDSLIENIVKFTNQ